LQHFKAFFKFKIKRFMSNAESKVIIPPHSKDSEMMVLGSMLTSSSRLNIAADALDDSDFYFSEHKIIFGALKTAYKNDKPADIHLISEELKRQNKLQAVGGIAYLTSLAQYAGTAPYIEEYAELVKAKSLLRRMVHTAQEIEREALSDPADVHVALDGAQQKFFAISQAANPSAGILIKEILSGVKALSRLPYLKELQERQENYQKKGAEDPGISGMPTHFIDLDKMVGGLSPSNLMILAARPAMGKTALALNIAENICFRNEIPVGIFSLEMTAEQLLHRIICSQAEVESDKIKNGSLSGIEFQRIVSCVNAMQNSAMIIDDQPGLKITDLRARARRMKEAYGVGFLVIDYLQLLSGSGYLKSVENRQMEISEISRMLKNLARELNIPILCLSQLSRKVEERQGHRPMMSDLRESGCLTGDTLIQESTTGKFYTLKELAERTEQTPLFVYAVDRDLKIGSHKMIKAFYSGKKRVFALKTGLGRSIKASANHPFLKVEGWMSLDKLKVGDRIALPRESAFQQPLYEIEEEELSLAEARSGDGGSLFSAGNARRRLDSFEGCLPTREMHALRQFSIYWDDIVSITPLGIEDVYDATVENVHNFVASDIIVHNSIEQDSDVVMFLLRREYYDAYDKPGMAELIVAKNRHGGVGSVNLTFRKEIAQFNNYSGIQAAAPAEEESDPFASFR
jgi:replicative DNA helicase